MSDGMDPERWKEAENRDLRSKSDLSDGLDAGALQNIANRVCKHCPDGWLISLHMEDGAASVTLMNDELEEVTLPDFAEKTLLEQLNDALCVANGWSI